VTPILTAATNGYRAVVKLMLEMGAELESKDEDGRTPLWWATRASNMFKQQSKDSYEAVVKLLTSVT
jgi:hypothetical protein